FDHGGTTQRLCDACPDSLRGLPADQGVESACQTRRHRSGGGDALQVVSELDEPIQAGETVAEMGLHPLAVDRATTAPCELLQKAELQTAVGGQLGPPVQVLQKPLGQTIKAIHQTSYS